MTEHILTDFEEQVESLTLVPSDGGVFEVTVDGELVFSKKQLGRHATYEEVRDAIQARLGG